MTTEVSQQHIGVFWILAPVRITVQEGKVFRVDHPTVEEAQKVFNTVGFFHTKDEAQACIDGNDDEDDAAEEIDSV